MTEERHKIIFVGDQGTGKTSILLRYVNKSFDKNGVKPTIGVNYLQKKLHIDEKYYTLNLWDTAGSEQFRSVTKTYYRDTTVAVIVFDLTRPPTFNSVNYWIGEIEKHCGQIPIIIAGGKNDLESQVAQEMVDDLKNHYSFIQTYFSTSACEGTNIDEMFDCIVKLCRNAPPKQRSTTTTTTTTVSIRETTSNSETKNQSNCC
ncbi:Ras-related protein Rab-35 [Entamoeba marina]